MPLYEYICEQGHIVDLWARVDERPESVPCKECGTTAKQRWAGKRVAFTNSPTRSGRRRRG